MSTIIVSKRAEYLMKVNSPSHNLPIPLTHPINNGSGHVWSQPILAATRFVYKTGINPAPYSSFHRLLLDGQGESYTLVEVRRPITGASGAVNLNHGGSWHCFTCAASAACTTASSQSAEHTCEDREQ